jgi:SET domain-containing protein
MSPSSLFVQLVEMASRATFDPASCFPSHPLLPNQPSTSKSSPARKISDYLEIIPIQGKGYGTVATKGISAYTFLFSESPAGYTAYNPRNLPQETASVAQAHRHMSPSIRARFDTLHEGAHPFSTRELRIWKANSFSFGPNDSVSAIFLDLSRINHSCLPNAEYHDNLEKERMELYAAKGIRKGEEVTICYGSDFHYRTGEERNAHLKYGFGFTCKCRACADPTFKAMKDRRRELLKEVSIVV